jgi:hypothetical protein
MGSSVIVSGFGKTMIGRESEGSQAKRYLPAKDSPVLALIFGWRNVVDAGTD